ncbi:MAG: twin-arginine translocase subunit TatB [Alphaproteobacteria bacterium]|nr:MAG: twin-arginine translocase subunit TatB [Alphaproteobacteria bacterium]
MFDIGGMELLVVGVLALVVVGPKDLPRLLRTVGGIVRKVREMASEFKAGVETLAAEAEQELDPFSDLRKKEGLRPGMSPEEVTRHIMANRDREEKVDEKPATTPEPAPEPAATPAPDAPEGGKEGGPA